MTNTYTGVFQKKGKWFIAWIEEIPGVNTQGKTLKEAKENLVEALGLIIDVNRQLSRQDKTPGRITRERLRIPA